jgi:hypothetical protein
MPHALVHPAPLRGARFAPAPDAGSAVVARLSLQLENDVKYSLLDGPWSAQAWWSRVVVEFDRGAPLGEVQVEAERALAVAIDARSHLAAELIMAPLRLVRTLRGVTPPFGSFDEDGFDEGRYERSLQEDPLLAHASPRYWLRKLQARLHGEDYNLAVVAADKARELMLAVPPSIESAEYHFHAALARATFAGVLPSAAEELPLIVAHHRQLAARAELDPGNLADRAGLVGAELARLSGRPGDAERLYDDAIRLSRQHGFVQNTGLSHELAARFHAKRGLDALALAHLHSARACYSRWGADGKVRQLDQCYPDLARDDGTEWLPVMSASVGARDVSDGSEDEPDFSEEFGAVRGFAGGSGFRYGDFERWV